MEENKNLENQNLDNNNEGEEVEKRLKSSTPKKELPLDREITKEDFNKLSLVEQVRIYNENPTLYKELTK